MISEPGMPPEVHSPSRRGVRSLQILGDQTEASLRKAVVGTAFTVLVMMLATCHSCVEKRYIIQRPQSRFMQQSDAISKESQSMPQ